MNVQTKPCPRCKGQFGWFEKRNHSYLQFFNEKGEISHATDSDGIGRGGKRKYCVNCNRDITDCVND